MDWLQVLQVIANIAQIFGVIWLLFFGGNATIKVIGDILKGRQPIRMPRASTVTNVLLALILLALLSLRLFPISNLTSASTPQTRTPTSTPTIAITPLSPTTIPTSSATTQSTVKEQHTFPLTAGLNGFKTDQSYTGTITLTVSGTGQAKQTAYSDPLYIYTDFNGNPIPPYHDPSFSLCINYKSVDNYWQSKPDYNPTHKYIFNITIPAPGDRLIFGICDDGVSDNKGSFTVTIS